MPLAWTATGGRPPNPGTPGGAAVGAALNMSSPEEDTISDYQYNRAGRSRQEGEGHYRISFQQD